MAVKATGGTITTPGDGYVYHHFTSDGTFTPTVSALDVDVEIIGGGAAGGGTGGSGGRRGGGGGAGEYRQELGVTVTSATTVTIGVGGSASAADGTASSFGALDADGGGGGGTISAAGKNSVGGSGGGSGMASSNNPTGAGTGGQGDGGSGTGASFAGGGGGSGGNGVNADSATSGGAGTTCFDGVARAGGGGGGGRGTVGSQGQAGGGQGGRGDTTTSAPTSATANSGSGGGGAGFLSAFGNGGSGIVIVRYADTPASDVTGDIALTEDDDTAAMSGYSVTIFGSISTTEADDTMEASGGGPASGSLAGSESLDTAVFTAQLTTNAVMAGVEAIDTMDALGATTYDVGGSIIGTEYDDTSQIQLYRPVTGDLNFFEEDDFVDSNEDWYGSVRTNIEERLSVANRRSRLQIPAAPADIPPAARRYLDTTFRNIMDEFNRLSGFQFEAINLIGETIDEQQDYIDTLIPLIPVNPDVPPPTYPGWNPNPTNPFPDGDNIIFTIPPTSCAGGYTEWVVQRQNIANPEWEDVTNGTTTSGIVAVPASFFSDEYTYRIRWREVCNGIPGPWQNGDPFTVPDEWGVCADPTNLASTDEAANLVAYVPSICPPSAIYEAISNNALALGPGFGGTLVGTAKHYVLSMPDDGGTMLQGIASAAASTNFPKSVQIQTYIPAGINDTDRVVWRVGGMLCGINRENGDLVPFCSLETDEGPKLVQGTNISFDSTVVIRGIYDENSGQLGVLVDGELAGKINVTGTPTQYASPPLTLVLPAGSWASECAAWNIAVDSLENQELFDDFNGGTQLDWYLVGASVSGDRMRGGGGDDVDYGIVQQTITQPDMWVEATVDWDVNDGGAGGYHPVGVTARNQGTTNPDPCYYGRHYDSGWEIYRIGNIGNLGTYVLLARVEDNTIQAPIRIRLEVEGTGTSVAIRLYEVVAGAKQLRASATDTSGNRVTAGDYAGFRNRFAVGYLDDWAAGIL